MTTYSTKIFLVLLGCFSVFHVVAQETATAFWQPQIALNYEVLPRYSHNFSLTNRNFLYQQEKLLFEGRHVDLSHFSSFSLRANKKIGVGILYRFLEPFNSNLNNEFRLTEQYNITTRPLVVRYGHRFRAEQRFFSNRTWHRFRYRFALDFPIQGEKVDIGESYLIINTEAALSVGKDLLPQYDQRLALIYGWLFTQNAQLQAGIEHRWENYTQSKRNVSFLTTSVILSL